MASLGVVPSGAGSAHDFRVRALMELWAALDADGSATISYDELLKALEPPKLALVPRRGGARARSGSRAGDADVSSAVAAGMRAKVTARLASPIEQLHEAFTESARTDAPATQPRRRCRTHFAYT